MSKLRIALILICLAHVCLSGRIKRDKVTENTSVGDNATAAATMTAVDFPGDNKNSTCREEFTLDDVEQMKTQLLAASMPEKDVNILGHVFTKMTSNTTDAEKMDGLMKLLMLIYAIDRNKTEEELLKLIESYDSSEVEEKVNPKKEIKNIL